MTRIERYKERIAKLEAKRNALMRQGRYMEYQELSDDIKNLEATIRQAEEYEESCRVRQIKDMAPKEELDRMGIIPLMIECYLISDMLVEASYMILDLCKENGFREVKLPKNLREAIKANEIFSSFLTTVSPEISDLLVRNETFNASLHKKYLKYIEQRMTPRKRNKMTSDSQQTECS